MADAREERQISHAAFWYTDADGIQRVALRGDKVELTSADIERGDAHGAFVTEGSEEASDLTYDPKKATVDEVLAYVGEDLSRASDALEYENTKDKPRSSLVEKLDAILGNDGD